MLKLPVLDFSLELTVKKHLKLEFQTSRLYTSVSIVQNMFFGEKNKKFTSTVYSEKKNYELKLLSQIDFCYKLL